MKNLYVTLSQIIKISSDGNSFENQLNKKTENHFRALIKSLEGFLFGDFIKTKITVNAWPNMFSKTTEEIIETLKKEGTKRGITSIWVDPDIMNHKAKNDHYIYMPSRLIRFLEVLEYTDIKSNSVILESYQRFSLENALTLVTGLLKLGQFDDSDGSSIVIFLNPELSVCKRLTVTRNPDGKLSIYTAELNDKDMFDIGDGILISA